MTIPQEAHRAETARITALANEILDLLTSKLGDNRLDFTVGACALMTVSYRWHRALYSGCGEDVGAGSVDERFLSVARTVIEQYSASIDAEIRLADAKAKAAGEGPTP
jgi:hypothetical protein